MVALWRSRGWHRGAVEKSGLANSCRREAVILPSGGLGKAWEGEERPSTRWPRGRECSIGLRLATLGHEVRALLRAGVGSVLPRRAGRAGQSLGRGCGCSRRPAGSQSLVTKALRSHSSHPLPSRRAQARAARRSQPGQGFPLPSFGKLAPQPVRRGGGAGQGAAGRAVFRTAPSPASFPGEWRKPPWPLYLSSRSEGRARF